MSSGIVDGLRQPEYTGENRCTPCTIVNTVIAVVVSVVIAGGLVVAGGLDSTISIAVGVAGFGVSAAAIYLRGYLVPKTPELTKRYFPDRVLAWFDKHPEPGGGFTAESTEETAAGDERQTIQEPDEDLNPEVALMEAGAVEECVDVEDLCLSGDFEAAWRSRITAARADDPDAEGIMAALDMPDVDGDVTVERYDNAVVLEHDGRQIGKWESGAALIADVTAAGELAERYDRWGELGPFDRSRLLRGLRIFVEQCPECDGPISLDQDTVESCCRSFDVVAVTCEACGSRLFEQQLQEGAA